MKRIYWVGVILLLLSLAASVAFAAGGYSLPWWTVDGGGQSSTSATYGLTGTIGQPDAGFSSGSNYQLSGGFWAGGATPEYRVYLPLVLKSP